MKLASLRIATEDVSRLAEFYAMLTQTEPVGNLDYVEFRTTGAVLAICSQRSIEAQNAGATCPATNRSAILEFRVQNVDAERTRLGSLVSEWVQEPRDQPWGNRSMLFRDPDGHLINFFSPINAETTEFDMRGYAADSVQQPAIKNATTF